MVALSKEQKAEARKVHIENALISFHEDMALVKSQYESGYHIVHIENGKAIDCDCGDFVYRSAYCKHREATEKRLASKPAKVRKTREVSPLVAQLQLPAGSKVRKVKGVLKVSSVVPVSDIKVSAPCPVDVDAIMEVYAREDEAEQDEIIAEAVFSTQERRERAPLNGNRGFNLLRV
jgi:hypothetical protein